MCARTPYIHTLLPNTPTHATHTHTHQYTHAHAPIYQELTLQDSPSLMTLVDERPTGKLCVCYQEQKRTVVDVIDEVKGVPQRVPNLDTSKVNTTEYANRVP